MSKEARTLFHGLWFTGKDTTVNMFAESNPKLYFHRINSDHTDPST